MEVKKVVLVTGGTSGVGLECSRALVARGYDVIATGRDVERGKAIAASIGITFRELELGSLKDVRRFVEELTKELQSESEGTARQLCAVVANAGLQMSSAQSRTEDGFEKTFGVNHLGHFLLVQLLLGKTPSVLTRPVRIVLVSSGTHDPAQKTPIEPPRYVNAEKLARGEYEGLDLTSVIAGRCCYSTSKLCNILFAFELNRKLTAMGLEKEIVVNAFDPGLTPGTSLARDAGVVANFVFQHVPVSIVRALFHSNTHSVEESGTSLANLSVKEEFAQISGKYFEHRNLTPFVRESSRDSLDEAKAKDLWDTSVRLVSLQSNETMFH